MGAILSFIRVAGVMAFEALVASFRYLVQWTLSATAGSLVEQKNFLILLGKIFKTTIKDPNAAKVLLSKLNTLSREDIVSGVYRVLVWISTDLGIEQAYEAIMGVASHESKVSDGHTPLANASRSVVEEISNAGPQKQQLVNKGLQAISSGLPKVIEGEIVPSTYDVALYHDAKSGDGALSRAIMQEKVIDIHARQMAITESVDVIETYGHQLRRAAAILGITKRQVIELAELLRQIDSSYEPLVAI